MPSDALPHLLFRWRNKYFYLSIRFPYRLGLLATRYEMCQEPTGCKKNLVQSWDGESPDQDNVAPICLNSEPFHVPGPVTVICAKQLRILAKAHDFHNNKELYLHQASLVTPNHGPWHPKAATVDYADTVGLWVGLLQHQILITSTSMLRDKGISIRKYLSSGLKFQLSYIPHWW